MGAGRRVPAGPRSGQKVGKVPIYVVTLWNWLCFPVSVTGPEVKIP